ncbi:hypothetical protein SRHO_G00260870 [Serrasalmus rhombeus]
MAERLGVPAEGIPELYSFATHLNIGRLEQFTQEDLQRAQLKDSVLKVVREALKTGHWPSHATDADVSLLKHVRLRLEDGLLCGVTTKASGKEHRQLLLPQEFRMQVCRALHDDLGVERSLELIRERVKPESGMGKLRTIHKDNILPIGSLVRISEELNFCELPVAVL